jgi:hypothetical protein
MSLQTQKILTPANIEDFLLAFLPILSGPTGSALINLTGLVPGVSGFILAVVIASLVKSSIGISQNTKSYEDWLNFAITFLGLVGAGLTGNSQVALAGIVLGFVAKALPSLANGINVEDVLLLVGSIVAGLGTLGTGNEWTAITNIGLLVATLGKAWPSISSGGQSGLPPATTTSSAPQAATAA